MTAEQHRRAAREWTDAEVDYVIAFRHCLGRGIRRYAGADTDDVVSREIDLLAPRLPQKMAAYPSPVALASTRIRGGRAYVDYLGDRRRRRAARPADTNLWEDGPRLRQVRPTAAVSFDDITIENDMLRQALLRLPLDQREVIVLVDLHGYSVNEAADIRGERRETTSRKRSEAHRTLRSFTDLQPPC